MINFQDYSVGAVGYTLFAIEANKIQHRLDVAGSEWSTYLCQLNPLPFSLDESISNVRVVG